MTTVRLYGRFFGNTSLAVVTRGFETALRGSGILAGSAHVESEESEDDDRAGADARHGVYVGPMGKFDEMMKRGLHQHYWLMVTPNSDRLPEDLIHVLQQWRAAPGRHLIAPSRWAAEVVAKEILGVGVVGIVPHGVSEEFRVQRDISAQTARDFEEGQFRVIHFSTSARQRKGTLELIQAWGMASLGPGAQLLCVMDAEAGYSLQSAMLDEGVSMPSGVRLVDRADLHPGAMAQNLARAHVVCQPSRGEGFGLVPLEALACGVPVVATVVTGHRDHLMPPAYSPESRPGVVQINTGALSPIDDLPGSAAPALSPGEIATALGAARRLWPGLQWHALASAAEVQRDWSWRASLGGFVERLKVT